MLAHSIIHFPSLGFTVKALPNYLFNSQSVWLTCRRPSGWDDARVAFRGSLLPYTYNMLDRNCTRNFTPVNHQWPLPFYDVSWSVRCPLLHNTTTIRRFPPHYHFPSLSLMYHCTSLSTIVAPPTDDKTDSKFNPNTLSSTAVGDWLV